MAGGEYQVDDYYEMIKKHMKNIKEDLESIRNDRTVQRRYRQTSGYYLVSLAGYTNAGKSSLLNLLSDEQITVENRLFSTLSITTRRIENKLPILLTDTVGFIQRLPSWIIDAFHSTLEEISMSDLILLIADGSDKFHVLQNKLQTSLQEFTELDVTTSTIIVLNKIDMISKTEIQQRMEQLQNIPRFSKIPIIPISVRKKKHINTLLETIFIHLPNRIYLRMYLPNNDEVQSFISWLHDKTFVKTMTYTSDITLEIECNQKIHQKIIDMVKRFHGTITEISHNKI
jgi:GTP-binding protein HflX